MKNIYHNDQIISFRKTKEEFGGLSNMVAGFGLFINNVPIRTSEAIYQACRFPHMPEIQKKIIEEKSPMAAKMVGKPYRQDTRGDWDDVRVPIMGWCLKAKLAQNFIKFGLLLEKTHNKQIVEDSHKDDFWGAVRDKINSKTLIGENKLGRLLTRLREIYISEERYKLLVLKPLEIPDFILFSEKIESIDERKNFCKTIIGNDDDKSQVISGGQTDIFN